MLSTSRIDPVLLDTCSGPETLNEIQQVLEETWGGHPEVPERVRLYVEIAAGEVGANILEHAAQGRPLRIRMDVNVGPNNVRITFRDGGDPAAVDLTSLRLPDAMAERGRGLALSRSLCSELSYRRDEDVNVWTLVSHRYG